MAIFALGVVVGFLIGGVTLWRICRSGERRRGRKFIEAIRANDDRRRAQMAFLEKESALVTSITGCDVGAQIPDRTPRSHVQQVLEAYGIHK